MHAQAVTEPTAAEAFATLDAKFTDLKTRCDLARDQLGQLRTDVDKARSVYRTALARAAIDGTIAPPRDELDAKERALVVAEDRLAGLEEAVSTLAPDWRSAKIDMLREEARALAAQVAEHQELIRSGEREIADINDRNGQHGTEITRLVFERQRRETDVLDLLKAAGR